MREKMSRTFFTLEQLEKEAEDMPDPDEQDPSSGKETIG